MSKSEVATNVIDVSEVTVMDESTEVASETTVITGLQSNFDYSSFPEDVRQEIATAVQTVKFELVKSAEQILRVGFAINILHQKSGSSFKRICEVEFPYIDERSVRRYLNAYKFAEANKIPNIQLIDPSAIYSLMRSTVPEGVLDLVKDRLEKGDKVKLADVKALIEDASQVNTTLTIELDEANTQIAELTKSLNDAQLKAETEELKASRLAAQNQKLIRNEDEANQTVIALTDEINESKTKLRELQDQLIEKEKNPAVITERIEVIPTGYASIQEAIKSQEAKLQEKEQSLKDANDRLIQTKRELLETEIEKKALEENKAEVKKFFEYIKDTVERYPSTIISAIFASESEETKKHLAKIAESFQLFASNINEAIKK
jgi:hypothetical protein